MAASQPQRPVTVTVGAAWTFHLDPRPQPGQNSLVNGIVFLAAVVSRLIFGGVFYRDCPQEPHIPIYLIGIALIALTGVLTVLYQRSTKRSSCFTVCLTCLINLFACIWIIAGSVRVFLAYQPNYDPTAADGLYCNKTLYTFAFWNAVWETFSFLAIIARMCRGLLLGVTVRPVATDTDFYGYV